MRQPPGPDDPSTVGRFRIVGLLGAGGMGRVLLGEDPSGRLAAVKLVHAELVDSDGFRARFRREVQMAAQAPPGWTAPFLDADPDAPQPWLATAYLDAPSLAEYLDEYGSCDPADAAGIGSGLAAALSALHAAGLVHRDLKPSNVLLGDGGPRLIDFGISRAVDGTALTPIGQTVGTPEYMSPEQVNGAEAGPPSDVFALGSLLVFATTGRTPFAAGSPAGALYRVVHAEPDLGDGVGPLEPVVRACLAKNPGARPPASWVRGQLGLLAGDDDGDDTDGEDVTVVAGVTREAPGPGAPPTGPGQAGRHAAPGTGGPATPPEPAAAGQWSSAPPAPSAPAGAGQWPSAPAGAGQWSSAPGGPGRPPPAGYPSGEPARIPAPRGPSPGGPIPGGPVSTPPPAARPPSRSRTPLLVVGAVVLAVVIGVGATLGVLALRPASSGTEGAPASSSANPFAAGTGTPSTSAAPVTDPAAGATVVDTSEDIRYGDPSEQLLFASPSGNIACAQGPFQVTCDVIERTWQLPPKPSTCRQAFGTGAEVSGAMPASLTCVGGLAADPGATVLDYDHALRTREIVCVSRTAGVECRNTTTGHGFAVSRGSYRLY